MNLLREEFCKETNTPMGLDDVYNYVEWLENKLQQERSYSEEEVLKMLEYAVHESRMQDDKMEDYIVNETIFEFKRNKLWKVKNY
jgi:hypothetical protein